MNAGLKVIELEQIESSLRAWWGAVGDGHGASGQWWPESDPFWVAVGAVLTQNTNWGNVEQALSRLRQAGVHGAESMLALPEAELAELIRPSGYFRVKAGRLRNLLCAWLHAGGVELLAGYDTNRLRHWLLAIKGVGPETADDILLYGFARPVFVIDAYTRRLLSRLGHETIASLGYEAMRAELEARFDDDVRRLGDMHGLIVEHAKRHCRVRPLCEGCPLVTDCHYR